MDILWCSSTCAPQGCSDCHSNYTQIPPLPVLRGQKGFFNQCSVDGWLLDTPTTSWPQTNHRQPACTCSQTHKPVKPGRPKVASNGVPTKNISRYVNYTLKQPLTLGIHYTSGTPPTTWTISDATLPQLYGISTGNPLVTLDVSSQCMNTPHNEGIAEFLDWRETEQLPTAD